MYHEGVNHHGKELFSTTKSTRSYSILTILALSLALLAACAPRQTKAPWEILAGGTPEEIQKMLQEKSTIKDYVNSTDHVGMTPLIGAAAQNPNPGAIKQLLAAGAKLNIRGPQGRTPLFYAVIYNPNPEITKTLLEAGAKLEDEDVDGATPLMGSFHNPNTEITRLLIASGADTKHRSDKGFTPLMVACRYAPPEIVNLLLTTGSDVNATTMRGITALMFAAAESHYPEIINMLVDAGANVAMVDKAGYNALAAARQRNPANKDMESALIKAGAQ